MFKGRTVLIATKHRKEQVIAPLLEQTLGVNCLLATNFDTDALGTFTGEVERKGDPISTVRNKCLLAMELYQCDMGVASEGSFGPHPSIPFLNASEEILMFIDKKHELEIMARTLSSDTNFDGEEIHSPEELQVFAERAKFPSHALILRPAKDSFAEIEKGITDWNRLWQVFERLQAKWGSVWAETDMRAMHNPTRMSIIRQTAQKLVEKINSYCPKCNTPGFGIAHVRSGLPCKLCSSPTQSVLSYVYICQKCSYSSEQLYPNKKTTEDPMFCDHCNP